MFSARLIPQEIERAQVRTTLTYQVTPRFRLGVEYNPEADDVGPLANLLILKEKERRPAIIAGTSSDRIGTPDGRAYFVTASKSLKEQLDWPVAPYVGVTYGEFEDRVRPIAGVRVGLPKNFSTTLIWDGVNLHPTADFSFRRHTFSFIWASVENPGIAYSISF